MKISVLTATYNRANLLDKLYASLLINSNNCPDVQLEWLVMDDGSTDNTKRIMEEYCKERLIDIKYFYQENQGKMTAINNLVKVATGDLIVECDSDDYFTRDAFRVVVQALQACKDMGETYALVFLKYTKDGQNPPKEGDAHGNANCRQHCPDGREHQPGRHFQGRAGLQRGLGPHHEDLRAGIQGLHHSPDHRLY